MELADNDFDMTVNQCPPTDMGPADSSRSRKLINDNPRIDQLESTVLIFSNRC